MKLYLMIGILFPAVTFGQLAPADMQRIKEVCNSDISEIRFSKSGGGCFSAYYEATTFYRKNRSFTTDTSARNVLFPQATTRRIQTISSLDICLFTYALPDLLEQPMTIQHMEFTQRDFEQCRKEIDTMRSAVAGSLQLKLQYGAFCKKDTDYQRLYASLDSLPKISPIKLEHLLVSDTTFPVPYRWEVLLNTTNGSYINISHTSGSRYSLISHWKVEIDGKVIYCNNAEINHFLKKNLPGFIRNDKMELLRWLIIKLST